MGGTVASDRRKRHGLDAIAVGVDHEGGVIFHTVMRPQAGGAVGAASRSERRSVEYIDIGDCFGVQAVMYAAFVRDFGHTGTQVDPEFGVGIAETDRRGPGDETRQPERCQDSLTEPRGAFEVAGGDFSGAVSKVGSLAALLT